MSEKTAVTKQTIPDITYYTLVRNGGAWSIRTITVHGEYVSGETTSEPDILAIQLAKVNLLLTESVR